MKISVYHLNDQYFMHATMEHEILLNW